MTLAYWDVDTQRDFMNKNGRLSVPNAHLIRPNLKRLTQNALENDILILGSSDDHFDDDKELDTFHPHCMHGSKGQLRIPETKTPETVIHNKLYPLQKPVKYLNNEIITEIKFGAPRITFLKQTTDVFKNKNVDKFLKILKMDEFVVYGVATEYCVKHAVLGLLERGYKVYLVTDAIKGINNVEVIKAMSEMMEAGVIPIDTYEATSGWFL